MAACSIFWVGTITNSYQLENIDDDYWLHTPVQRQIFEGHWPPVNPLVPEFSLQGHFVRDLLIAALAQTTGQSLLRSQWLATALCQCLALALIFLFLRQPQRPAREAWMGLGLIWFGLNVSFVTGLGEFLNNNGSLVYLHLALAMCLARWLWERPGLWRSMLLGLVGGSLAQTYETHFGLFWIATLLVLLAHPSGDRRSRWAAFGLSGALALALAVCNGGAITSLFCRDRSLDLQAENQSQQVRLSFPKARFGLWIGEREIHPLSVAYRFPPANLLLRVLDGPGARIDQNYVPLWSWTVLRMHWLALYAAPFSLIVLRRQGHLAGQWLVCFGLAAFVVPGVVDFGANHEHEYLRWQVAAAFGLAGALGLCLALPQRLWARLLCIAIWSSLMAPGLVSQGRRLFGVPSQGVTRVLGLDWTDRDWFLAHGQALRLTADDLEALAWLAGKCRPGQRVLVNYDGSDPWSILFEATLSQITGLELCGHQLPPPGVAVGACPLQQTSQVRDFLDLPASAERLRRLRLDWLYFRGVSPEFGQKLESNGMILLKQQFGRVSIYGLEGGSSKQR